MIIGGDMKNIRSLLTRENIVNAVRDFFCARGFREVIVPIFNTSLPLEPNIYAFQVGDYFLPTSPEATLKKAIAAGAGNCFAIGHTFRDLENSSPIHKSEFLMLEWYKKNADYADIMGECEELIYHLTKKNIFNKTQRSRKSVEWGKISMEDLFRKYAKLDLEKITDGEEILKVAKARGYNIKNASWEQIFNQIFLNEIDPHLPKEPFFLVDYPARISPLCAKRQGKPYLAERFELYINGIEIANGNTENTDAAEVLSSMKEEEKYRVQNALVCPPIDMEFIDALRKMQGKNYAGIGLGIERLAMVLAGVKDIKQLT